KTAGYEYEICFKCHSGFNSAYVPGAAPVGANATFSWGGSGASAWTNVALEFNPNNTSYHPVVAPTNNSATVYGPYMLSTWTAVSAQTMACSDCHGDSDLTVAAGPHGSAIPRILKGSWPMRTDGTAYTLGGSYAGLLCAQCHRVATTNPSPGVHKSNNHGGVACYRCHIAVPHGGALQGLIGDANSSMPSRYAFDSSKASLWVSAYTGGNGDTRGNCWVTAGSGCGTHSTTPGASGNW
ncbi:MAG: hypothetical protein JXA58_07705, partial [Dehalococcoidia bacterium]|nr:hypothetical protein [Dehalococcoidia bacterium]